MEFRSTNDQGYTHLKGDLVTHVSSGGVDNSSHGVHLRGSNTGGIITAAGDETNIALTIRAKGSGPLTLGTTGGAGVFTGGSTAPFAGFIRTAISSFSTPAANSTNIMTVESTATFTGINSSCFILFNSSNLSTDITLTWVRCSTVNEVRMTFIKTSTVAIGTGSTARGSFCAIRF